MTRYHAFSQKNWEKMGLANVVVTRVRDNGTADFAFFLVDLFCLGVKDAFVGPEMSEDDLRDQLDEQLPDDERETIHPACAKKLIEGAVAYAESLGFSPHRDFRKARRILSGIDASVCPREFTYGRDGRPCYVRGRDDSDERVKRVLAILSARFDEDDYDYEDPSAEEAELAFRGELMDFLDAEPDDVPRFYYFSGAITALLLTPSAPPPLTIADLLWGKEGRVWSDKAEMQEFFDRFLLYWNLINDDILAAIEPGNVAESPIVDIDSAEFDDDGDDGISLVAACMEWSNGFEAVVDLFPDAWREPRGRPDLQPHWEMLGWWAAFPDDKNMDRIERAIDADKSRTLNGAVCAIARAVRLPLAPDAGLEGNSRN